MRTRTGACVPALPRHTGVVRSNPQLLLVLLRHLLPEARAVRRAARDSEEGELLLVRLEHGRVARGGRSLRARRHGARVERPALHLRHLELPLAVGGARSRRCLLRRRCGGSRRHRRVGEGDGRAAVAGAEILREEERLRALNAADANAVGQELQSSPGMSG